MRRRVIGAIAVVAFLLIGGVAIGHAALDDDAVAQVTVPVGRIGDEVDYIVRWHDRLADDSTEIDERGEWDYGFKITRMADARDATGVVHDAVALAYGWPGWEDSYWLAKYLDLRSGAIIETREGWSVPGDDGSLAWYGPERAARNPYDVGYGGWGPYANYDAATALQRQGTTLQIGDDFTASDLAGSFGMLLENPVLNVDYIGGGVPERFISADYSRVVDGWGTIGPYEVIGVVETMDLQYERSVLAPDGTMDPRMWRDQWQTVTWWSEQVPYPVRIEHTMARDAEGGTRDHYHFDKVDNYTAVQDLLRYEPGHELIPWLDGDGDAFRAADPGVERGPSGVRHPVSGADDGFPYPFDDALANVLADANLQGFNAWRGAYPNHHLVGAWFAKNAKAFEEASADVCESAETAMEPAPADVPRPCPNPLILHGSEPDDWPVGYWELMFATPGEDGRVYKVLTSQYSTGTVENEGEDLGAVPPISTFDIQDLPDRPATFGWAHGLHLEMLSAMEDPPVAYSFGWGYHDARQAGSQYTMIGDFELFWGDAYRIEPNISPTVTEGDANLYHAATQVEASSGNLTFGWTEETIDSYIFGGGLAPPTPIPLLQDTKTGVAPDASAPPSYPFIALATSSALALFLAVYFYPLLKYAATRGALVAGFSKLKPEALRDNRFRDDIMHHVEADPGISPAELHRVVGGGWSTVVYHLGVLERNGLLRAVVDGRHKRIFPATGLDHGHITRAAALRNESTRRIYSLIQGKPGLTNAQLSRRMGLTSKAIAWHLDRLKSADLVTGERDGRRVHYAISKDSRA